MEDLQSAATQFINTTSSHIFLTGKAGTGKTTFLKNLGNLTHKTHIVVAPTGIAALNAGGVTIHSQFLLPPMTFLPDRSLPETMGEGGRFMNQNTLARKHPLNSTRKQVLRSIDLLVIDEVSMLRADLLDAIDYRMRAARNNFRESFGGVQVLFIGDLFQLPPVVRNEEKETLGRYYKNFWFYEAMALQKDPLVYIELDKIFRQHDPLFIDILNNLRNNVTTAEDIHTLNRHFKTAEEIKGIGEVITLTTHNFKADELNQTELRNLKTPQHLFNVKLDGEFPESMYPVLPTIELKEGAQIMFIRNDNLDKMYFNGKLATVVEIAGDNIWVELAESKVRYKLKRELWENKKYTLQDSTHDLAEDVIGTFEQYPIKLAWAITVHKSQGLTFDKAIIDVAQAFADGQVYVALSRLRSLEGLILRTKINPSVISTDRHIAAFVQNNHRPLELAEVMKSRQQHFVRQLLDKTFDFTTLVKEIRYLEKDQSAEEFTESSMKSVLRQIAETLEAEFSNSERFKRQLSELLQGEDKEAMLDRIRKGRDYYKKHLWQSLRILLHRIELLRTQKRVKTQLNQLTDLDVALGKKLEEMDKASFLIEAILNGEVKFDFSALSKMRAEERAILLNEIRKQVETEAPSASPRKPRKSGKARKKGDKSTYDITLEFFNNGLTVEQIAKERELVISTIESHLARAVAEDKLNIFKFMSEEAVKEILEAHQGLSEGSGSKELYTILKGKFGYGHLRAVMAHAGREWVKKD